MTYLNEQKRFAIVFSLLIILTAAAVCVSLFTGSANIPPSRAIGVLFGNDGDGTAREIMMKIRVPRALAALLLGGALSLSGYLLQTFFRNPIAGPFVLGVSSGAKLIVAFAMIGAAAVRHPLSSLDMICASFIGSLMALGIVLIISRRVRNMAVLVVCGVMIGYICSAVTEFAVTFADDSNIINLHSWSMGSFSGAAMDNVLVIFITVVISLSASMLLAKPLSAYRLGDAYAQSLGVSTSLIRAALIALSGLLSACVTAFAGPVSFVGIAVPHIMRQTLGTSKPIVLIPACFLGGSIFCIICDIIARSIFAPVEMSISAVTAIFGAPVVIAAMLSGKRGDF